ncbi:MAG: NACHT domain-containing protein [Pseudonocardiaceae bacterium]
METAFVTASAWATPAPSLAMISSGKGIARPTRQRLELKISVDYDLSRLNTREFEHLGQSLCLKALGPQLGIFGDGPDGGREAAFNGPVTYSTKSQAWNGRGVVQAKFRQRSGGKISDVDWLGQAIRAEFSQWLDPRSKRGTTPDYFLFVTNVVLTPVAQSGGQAVINCLIESYAESLGLKGYDVWHYDKICRLLDDADYRIIKRRYAAFLAPGDVLSKLCDLLDGRTKAMEGVWAIHTVQELLSQQWVSLGQAGDSGADRLALGQVAVDLPAERRVADAVRIEGLVGEIIRRGDRVLSPSVLDPSEDSAKIMIVGGPGQGKSTIGQLVCQLYRSAMLQHRPPSLLGPKAPSVLEALAKCWQEEDFPLPSVRRWPIHVNLSSYGETILGGEDITLLRYIAGKVSKRSSENVSAADLKEWLGAWPWMLILDGFDEVAAPSVRRNIEQAVDDFLIEASTVDADLLAIATTRPQGYSNEFAPAEWEHIELLPLSCPTALHYAHRLVLIRHEDDLDTQERVLARLGEAAEQPNTAKLMRTPLQVTIMSILLDRHNQVPSDRYSLFNAYYEVIFNREASKDESVSLLLRRHKRHVEYLHMMTGFILQLRTEAGHDDSIPEYLLKQLALDRLHAEGHAESEITRLTDQIVTAATNRLVLLVPAKIGEIGFEVRSIQESMAALELLNANDNVIMKRLATLAHSAHWRNTWLFAVGRLFATREPLRDTIVTLLRELDTSSATAAFLAPGATLAIDILEDDITAQAPRYEKLFVAQALEILKHPPNSPLDRLAPILQRCIENNGSIREVIQAAIASCLAASGIQRVSAICLLILLDELNGSLSSYAANILRREKNRSREEGIIAESRYCQTPIFGDGSSISVKRSIGASLAKVGSAMLTKNDLTPIKPFIESLEEVSADSNWVSINGGLDGLRQAEKHFGNADEVSRNTIIDLTRVLPVEDYPNYAAIWRLIWSWHARQFCSKHLITDDPTFSYAWACAMHREI